MELQRSSESAAFDGIRKATPLGRRLAWSAIAAASLSAPALADAPRHERLTPPQISGVVVEPEAAGETPAPVLQASLRAEGAVARSASSPFEPASGAFAAGRNGLNAGAPAKPGAQSVGAAFDPALADEVAAAAERMGPIARPSETGMALMAALRRADPALRAAYAAGGYEPVFIDAAGGVAKAQSLIKAIAAADRHALPTKRYEARKLSKMLEAALEDGRIPDPGLAAGVEKAFAETYLKLASDLSAGAYRPRDFGRDIDVTRPEVSIEALLLLARKSGDLVALTDALPPQSRDYQGLLAVYAALRDIAARNVWPAPVHGDGSLRPFDRGPRIDALRARLIALGDLDPRAPRSVHPETGEALFDAALEGGVKAFQRRNGLAEDGVVGANTLKTLNASAAERAMQVAVNLERARWHDKPLGRRHVQVNIPDYHVDVMQDGASIYRSRVVVGQYKHQTPEFSDEMTHVIVNPYWHVPYSIATEELLPELREVPGVLAARNIHVYGENGRQVDPWTVDWWSVDEGFFPYRLRQGPGQGNALGEVKFIFPNHHAVYLHDTPSRRLFAKPGRAFSHGCVRVAEPQLLAQTLLSAQMQDAPASYRQMLRRGDEQHVEIKRPVPVHILYRTAWVDHDGRLQLRQDVYRRDARVAAALKRDGLAL